MNQVTIIGRLTKDNVLNQFNNHQVLKNSIAISSKINGKEKTTFIEVVAWNKIATAICNYTKKGNEIAISGRLENENWIDKETNKNRSKVVVLIEKIKLLNNNQKQQAQDSFEQTFNQANETIEESDLPFY